MRFLIPLLPLLLLSGCPTGPTPEKIAELNEVAIASEGISALKPGSAAPEFTATTATGERVTVGRSEVGAGQGDADGTREIYTVLYFFPAGATPNSTKHLLDLSKGQDQLDAQDIQVYGVSTATAEQLAEFASKHGVTVPLLADTGAISGAYGALLDKGQFPQRTLVGIEPDGTIGFYLRGFAHRQLVNLILELTGRAPQE